MSLPESYTVELQDVANPASIRTFVGVTSDGILQDQQQNYISYRYLVLQDQTRYEFPMERYVTRFSPERALIAEANAQRLAVQKQAVQDAERPKMN